MWICFPCPLLLSSYKMSTSPAQDLHIIISEKNGLFCGWSKSKLMTATVSQALVLEVPSIAKCHSWITSSVCEVRISPIVRQSPQGTKKTQLLYFIWKIQGDHNQYSNNTPIAITPHDLLCDFVILPHPHSTRDLYSYLIRELKHRPFQLQTIPRDGASRQKGGLPSLQE